MEATHSLLTNQKEEEYLLLFSILGQMHLPGSCSTIDRKVSPGYP